MQNKLPNFEANQVLSNDHLNQVVAYLEEQGRLTRNHLLGNGIVSGLEVHRNTDTTVAISEGVGVTSAGYLLVQPAGAGGNRLTNYNKKKRFQPGAMLFPYKQDLVNTTNVYDLFDGISDLWQLVETAVPDDTDPGNITQLTAQDLNGRVVVLFLQVQVKELKSCEADSCMELGRQWTFNLLPFLVSAGDAGRLLQQEQSFVPPLVPGSDPSPLVHPAYHLPDLALPQPAFSTLTDKASLHDIAELYSDVIKKLLAALSNPDEADQCIRSILKENFTQAPLAAFKKKLAEFINVKAAIGRPEFFQYAYGFAKDFCAAYRELQEAVFDYHSYEVPVISSFPHHLRLGTVPPRGRVVSSAIYPPDAYRHGFTSTRNAELQQQAYKSVTLLYQRLLQMLENFTTKLPINDIRITPSLENNHPLSDSAIPFYYETDRDGSSVLQETWNPKIHMRNQFRRLLNYYSNLHTVTPGVLKNQGNAGAAKTTGAPLSHYHADKDFYRIEGHVGAAYTDVFTTLQQYIANYNLAFDLQLVRLNKATVMLIKDKHILLHDLDSLYNVVREEIRSLLTTELNYFNNIRLSKRTSRTLATQAVLATDNLRAAPATTATAAAANELDQPLLMTMNLAKQKTSTYFTNQPVTMQVADLGVTDSMAYYTNKFQGKIAAVDITNLLGGVGSIGIINTRTTAAAPFITRIITAINNFNKVLDAALEDFKIAGYLTALAALEAETKSFVLFAKNLSDAVLRSDNNITKGELLDYLDRILFECDFEKISAIDEERTRREQQVGINNYLHQYITNNPGVAHRAGVNTGGTFVVVFDEKGTVVADLCLPYRSCAGNNATQFVLGVLKTILLAGQVVDVNNVPVKNAVVMLNDETLVLDDAAHFKKAVPPNSFLLLKISAPEFESTELMINALEDDILKNITLFTKAQELKTNFILTVTGSDGKPLPNAVAMLDGNTISLDANGVFKGQVKANASFVLTVTLNGFSTYTEAFTTTTADKTTTAILVKQVSISGSVVGPDQKPVASPSIFINGALTKADANGKFQISGLAGDGTYNLVIEAENLEKLADTIKPNNVDVVKNYQLKSIATLSVRVGIYIPSKPVFTRTDPVVTGRITTLTRPNTGNTLVTRLTNTTVNPLVTANNGGGSIGARGTSEFEFLSNADVSSEIDGALQPYNAALRLFASEERKGQHKLTVSVKPVRLNFSVPLAVTDMDLLVLVPATQNYKTEAVFSIVPNADASNMKACNAFLVKQFSMKADSIVMSRSLEIRIFTKAEAVELAELMNEAKVKFITTTQR